MFKTLIMQTSLITKAQVEKAFSMQEYIDTVEKVFKLYGEGKVEMPSKVYLSFEKGDLRSMPASIPDMKIAGVKNVNVHPGNKDLPVVMATVTLIDPENGFPLAIMDGTYLTGMRTGAAGAVAAKYLSREDATTAGFIGAGQQAHTQLEGLMLVRKISRVLVHDMSEEHMKKFAYDVKAKYGIAAEAVSADEVCKADIVTTTTPSRTPVLDSVGKGTHINAIGADAPGKQEINPEVLKDALVVIDDWEQASHSGEINVPLKKGVVSKEDIYANIGEIVCGKKACRESADQITVFDSTGLAIQDISCASEIFRKLQSEDLQKIKFF
jgi:alanine dehydrogenase